MTEMMLEVTGADFRYANSDCGITDVSLQLSPGRMTGLIGPNGAGKSTLMQIAAGLIVPSAGSVKIKDRDSFALAVLEQRFLRCGQPDGRSESRLLL